MIASLALAGFAGYRMGYSDGYDTAYMECAEMDEGDDDA